MAWKLSDWTNIIDTINDRIDEINEQLDTSEEPIELLEEITSPHIWSVDDVQAVRDKLKEICHKAPDEWDEPLTIWTQALIDEIQDVIDDCCEEWPGLYTVVPTPNAPYTMTSSGNHEVWSLNTTLLYHYGVTMGGTFDCDPIHAGSYYYYVRNQTGLYQQWPGGGIQFGLDGWANQQWIVISYVTESGYGGGLHLYEGSGYKIISGVRPLNSHGYGPSLSFNVASVSLSVDATYSGDGCSVLFHHEETVEPTMYIGSYEELAPLITELRDTLPLFHTTKLSADPNEQYGYFTNAINNCIYWADKRPITCAPLITSEV